MKNLLLSKGFFPETLLRPTVNYILQTQLTNGCIPWFNGGKADPWDHIEAAMGLTIGGEIVAAQQAYRWLAREQLSDGSWWANYTYASTDSDIHKNTDTTTLVDRDHRETNFIAYIATGVWHYFLITRDEVFLRELFPSVVRAIDFVLRYQAPGGEIYWAVSENGAAKADALITACASIYKSLECAILCAESLAVDASHWHLARERLGQTLYQRPQNFDRTWASKERFSMDWFYPILTGVISGKAAQQRIEKKWSLFVETNIGCRCVSDEPWVTVAESCELTLALLAAGEHARALTVFSWLHQFMDSDGGYWTGYNFRDQVIWPKEKTTWTAGAVLLAADALTGYSPAAKLFTQHDDLAKTRLDAAQSRENWQRD
jgi:hypothetical protein